MIKVTEYFYIFTKLTTSIVLFSIILIMGYALYNSYQRIDRTNDLGFKIESIIKIISDNNVNFLNLEKKLNSNIKSTNDLKNSLEQDYKDNFSGEKFSKDIKNLLSLSNKLQENFIQLKQDFNQIKDLKINNNSVKNLNRIDSFFEVILSKYQNGNKVLDDILLLESFSPQKTKEVFEKLYVLESKNFYGFNNLENDFNNSLNEFVRNKFLEENQNSVLNFLFKFVNIKPGNLNIYENEELNILMKAKKFFEIKDLEKSLQQINLIDKEKLFFKRWINQSKIYLDFKSTLMKVI